MYAAQKPVPGIGWTWGGGVLSYGGKRHRFKVEGLTLNGAGVERFDATGYVYDLKKLSDFAGNYTSVEAGAAAGALRDGDRAAVRFDDVARQ